MVMRAKKRKRAAAPEVAEGTAPSAAAAPTAETEGTAPSAAAAPAAETEGTPEGAVPVKKKRKAAKVEAAAGAGPRAAAAEQPAAASEGTAEAAEIDRRGIIHMATVPAFMGADKVRHLMEEFGEVGRVYLAPEDRTETSKRKRAGGNRKLRFTEGWVEFMDRRLAKRVAETLNGSTIGGRKRHNFYRDDLWNMKYLPRFKWHHLKEASIYNRHVRKARLDQKLSQARRENDLFLERVSQAKTRRRIDEKRATKAGKAGGAAAAGKDERPGSAGTALDGGGASRFGAAARRASARPAAKEVQKDGPISEKLLNSLFG